MFDTISQTSQTVFAGSSAHAEFFCACSCAGTTQFSLGSCYADTPTTLDTSTPNTLDTSASTSAASLEKERTTTVVISSLAFWILQIYNIKLKMHGETAFAILQVINNPFSKRYLDISMGKIAEKALCWSVFLTIWHCILSTE